MARRAKTETLSLRLDPKTKFMLDFMARVQGRSITAALEHAIRAAAREVKLGFDDRNWEAFWDPNEGVRTLRLLADPEYPTSYEEDELRAFAEAHWEFFYHDPKGRQPKDGNLVVLWPNVEHYASVWRDTRQTNYWAAGEEMARDLRSARLAAPEWPRGSKPKKEDFSADLDDEIPF